MSLKKTLLILLFSCILNTVFAEQIAVSIHNHPADFTDGTWWKKYNKKEHKERPHTLLWMAWRAKEQGCKALVVTPHDFCKGRGSELYCKNHHHFSSFWNWQDLLSAAEKAEKKYNIFVFCGTEAALSDSKKGKTDVHDNRHALLLFHKQDFPPRGAPFDPDRSDFDEKRFLNDVASYNYRHKNFDPLVTVVAHHSIWKKKIDPWAACFFTAIEIMNDPRNLSRESDDVFLHRQIMRNKVPVAVTAGLDLHQEIPGLYEFKLKQTMVFVENVSKEEIVRGLRFGRCYASKFGARIEDLNYKMGFEPTQVDKVRLSFRVRLARLPQSPITIVVYRDGAKVHSKTHYPLPPRYPLPVYIEASKRLEFDFEDSSVSEGRHYYTIHVPGQIYASPIILDVVRGGERDLEWTKRCDLGPGVYVVNGGQIYFTSINGRATICLGQFDHKRRVWHKKSKMYIPMVWTRVVSGDGKTLGKYWSGKSERGYTLISVDRPKDAPTWDQQTKGVFAAHDHFPLDVNIIDDKDQIFPHFIADDLIVYFDKSELQEKGPIPDFSRFCACLRKKKRGGELDIWNDGFYVEVQSLSPHFR